MLGKTQTARMLIDIFKDHNSKMSALLGKDFAEGTLERSKTSLSDRLVVAGVFFAKNTLFTKQEASYFNFYLNKKEFTNGLDLRNKYLHGTNSASKQQHKNEYYILLRLIILVSLKIDDDLTLHKEHPSELIC